MKTTIVPAQVTTVEDKITGNLGVSQMLLLVAPVFIGSLLFVLLPPFYEYAVYKVVLLAMLALFCMTLAIRIRGKIVLSWIGIMLHYNMRPKYYVFNKNDMHLRYEEYPEDESVMVTAEKKQSHQTVAGLITLPDAVSVEQLIANPSANFRLKVSKKGKLSVHLTEI